MVEKPILSQKLPVFRGELALAIAVVINSFGVVLMLYSGAGISAISSVPYAFSEAFPLLTLGTWTYLFQAALVLSLMMLRRKFVLPYLLSFVVSYLLICVGIAFSNRCGLPIVPTDLFPREFSLITGIGYPKVKISFDALCLMVTAGLTFCFLGRIRGIGIGTVLAALTMGKTIGVIGGWMDQHFTFVTGQGRRE